ncbi:SNF2-related protein, partial [mine drainage metagenome]
MDGNEAENATFSFQEWHVQGLSMKVNDVFPILLRMDEGAENGSFVMGTDLKFWKSASAMAFNLLTQQKFLPAVTEEGTTIRSKWIPLMETQEDQDVLYDFSKNMPGACLAFNHGEIDPETMVRTFFSTVIDGMCRKYAGNGGIPAGMSSGGDALKWVKSLTSENSLVTYSKSLAMQKITSWARRIQNTLEFPLRTCFDLVPPEENGETWFLRFLLQSKKDPSLMMPYSGIWDRKDKEALSTITKFTEFPEEFLLQSLGVVQSIFPPVRKSLQIARPSGVNLTSDEVFDLLKNYSIIMKESGFGILFPDWWGKAGKKLGLKVKAKPAEGKGSGKLGMLALLDYELEIVLDGEPVS